jgi:hypothetical protein
MGLEPKQLGEMLGAMGHKTVARTHALFEQFALQEL